jgi:hypothetical protein
MSERLDTFLLSFGGQEVTITVSLTGSFQDSHGNVIDSVPMMYDGILLEHDDNYVYLGKNINIVDQAITKSTIVHVALKKEISELDQILDGMLMPSKKEDIN